MRSAATFPSLDSHIDPHRAGQQKSTHFVCLLKVQKNLNFQICSGTFFTFEKIHRQDPLQAMQSATIFF
jgi:hypothetical protein